MLDEIAIGIKPKGTSISADPAWFFIYRDDKILWPGSDSGLEPLKPVPLTALNVESSLAQFIGERAGLPGYLVEPGEDYVAPAGYRWVDLRQTLSIADEEMFALAGRARQIAYFKRTNRFCGECGNETRPGTTELSLICKACGHVHYPRIAPCVIVLVTKGEYLLLAQGTRHATGLYSTLAGFIEAGETCEQTIHREILEEVNLEVEQLQYFDSQVWPFPHQLMLGYFARYKSGEISPQPDEIVDAQWWHYTDLPKHPPAATISGRLIRTFVSQMKKHNGRD